MPLADDHTQITLDRAAFLQHGELLGSLQGRSDQLLVNVSDIKDSVEELFSTVDELKESARNDIKDLHTKLDTLKDLVLDALTKPK